MMFLLKPHITGAEGQVTSPDVIVDSMVIDGEPHALSKLTHDAWQQSSPSLSVQPAYGLMSLGGGAILLPALLLSTGTIVVARSAWRLNNLDDHVAQVTLNDVALADVDLPSALITANHGDGDQLPRGLLLIRSINGKATAASLFDPVLDRRLCLKLHTESLDHDRWGDQRPRSRYSVGPTQKEVKHYI